MAEIEIMRAMGETEPYKVKEEPLKKILRGGDVINAPTVVISLIGDSKTGKGILMSGIHACLKMEDYMDIECLSNSQIYDRVRTQPQHNAGIHVWGGPFKKTIDGKNHSVILMVAQITICEEKKPNTTHSIMALASYLSSIRILNVRESLEKKDLHCAKNILELSDLASGEACLLICVQKYPCNDVTHDVDGAEYFRNQIEDRVNDDPKTKDAKEFLRNKGNKVQCFIFPDSKAKRDPEQNPDLNSYFLRKVTRFTQQNLSGEVLKACKKRTGEELMRYAEELNREIDNEINPETLKQITKQVEYEKAFKERMKEASPNLLSDEGRLVDLGEKAKNAATEKVPDMKQPFLVRAKENNSRVYEKFEEAGKKIREAIQPLNLNCARSRGERRHPSVSMHPEGEQSETASEASGHIEERIEVYNEGAATGRPSQRARRKRSDKGSSAVANPDRLTRSKVRKRNVKK